MKPTSAQIRFSRILQILGYTADDHVGILTISPDRTIGARTVTTWEAARHQPDPAINEFYGVNPVRPMPAGRRGSAEDVTRVVAVYADLDVKPGGFDTLDIAKACAAEIGITVGTRARITVESGGGLHAIWPLSSPIAPGQLPRWHQLVTRHAAKWNVKPDNISEPARVLRMPGSMNHKFDPPRPCTAYEHSHGKPIDTWDLNDILDEYAPVPIAAPITDEPEAGAPHTNWAWAEETCAFMRTFIATVTDDTPTARHPWLVSQYVRLTSAVANGCITQADHKTAFERINARMRILVGLTPARPYDPEEILDAARHAIGIVETKSPASIAAELGGHLHTNPLIELLKVNP